MTLNRTILDSPRVFAGILAILVLSIAYYMLARALESRMVVWQSAGPAAEGIARATRTVGRAGAGRGLSLARIRRMPRSIARPCHRTCCPPPSSAAIRSPTGW